MHTVTYTDSRRVVRDHFCDLFQGKCQPLADIIDDSRTVKLHDISRNKKLPSIQPNLVPSVGALGKKYAHRKPLLGTGEDLVGSEVEHSFPCIFCRSVPSARC